MITESKPSIPSNLRTMIDLLAVGLGLVLGGVIALVGLWLLFDYQAHPSHSYLALLSSYLVSAIPASVQSFFGQQAQVMDLPLTGQTAAFWYMARAGGLAAYLLMWLSMIWGLLLSTKVASNLVPAPLAYGLHEFLSILAIVFALLHTLVLLGDSYINFTIFHLLIPFIAPYEPLWTGLGIIGFYLSLAMTGSFYIRKQIGQKSWRLLHYFTFVAYLLTLGHGLMAGTDTSSGLVKLFYLTTGLSVLFLVYYRLLTLKIKPRKA